MGIATVMKPRPTPLRDPAEMPLERLDRNPRYVAAHTELAAIESRIAKAEQRRDVALARGRGQPPTRTPSELAADLVAGARIAPFLPPAAELDAVAEELRLLHAARLAKNEQLAALAGELSREVCEKFSPLNDQALVAALRAAEDLFSSLEVSRVIRGRIIGAGYQLVENAISIERFPSAAALGDPAAVGGMSASGMFRERLVSRGVI